MIDKTLTSCLNECKLRTISAIQKITGMFQVLNFKVISKIFKNKPEKHFFIDILVGIKMKCTTCWIHSEIEAMWMKDG